MAGSRATTAGAPMRTCLLTLTIIAGCAAWSAPAFAQSAVPQVSAVAPAAPKAAAGAAKPADVITAASPDARVLLRTPGTTAATLTIAAAGSLIVLRDGVVANANLAQIQPPAPGFVYER
jgi:hypothetical protein